jgi:fermentation-respiration switch protein FrsA (DUF1100 family)
MVAERFKNIESISKVTCPTFILHGMKDTLVPYTHSQVLCDSCGGPSFLLLPENMDHNNLEVVGDFIAPLSEFLDNFSISTHNHHLKSPKVQSMQNSPRKHCDMINQEEVMEENMIKPKKCVERA